MSDWILDAQLFSVAVQSMQREPMKSIVCRRELLRQINGPQDGINWTDVPQCIRDDEEFRELAEKAKEVHAEAMRSVPCTRRYEALIERLHFLQGKMRSRWCLLIGAPTA